MVQRPPLRVVAGQSSPPAALLLPSRRRCGFLRLLILLAHRFRHLPCCSFHFSAQFRHLQCLSDFDMTFSCQNDLLLWHRLLLELCRCDEIEVRCIWRQTLIQILHFRCRNGPEQAVLDDEIEVVRSLQCCISLELCCMVRDRQSHLANDTNNDRPRRRMVCWVFWFCQRSACWDLCLDLHRYQHEWRCEWHCNHATHEPLPV